MRKVLEKIGHLCDYVLWDEAWIGYNAFHPLFTDHSPMRLEEPQAGDGRACSRRSRCTSRAPASRRPRRSTSATSTSRGQKRFIEHKRFNESFLMYCSTSPFYPLFAALDVNAEDPRRQGRRDAVGPLHRARHRGAQEAARVRPATTQAPGATPRRSGSSIRSCPTSSTIRGSKFTRGRDQRRLGRPADRRAQARAAVLDLRSEGHVARLLRATRKATRWSTRTSSCC